MKEWKIIDDLKKSDMNKWDESHTQTQQTTKLNTNDKNRRY